MNDRQEVIVDLDQMVNTIRAKSASRTRRRDVASATLATAESKTGVQVSSVDPTSSKFYVYLITNKNNGMQYVGQSQYPPFVRLCMHVTDAFVQLSNRPLQRAIRAVGPENFTVETLEVAGDRLSARAYENLYIQSYNTQHAGYNRDTTFKIGNGKHAVSTSVLAYEYQEGASTGVLSRKYKISRNCVLLRLKEAGVPTRSRSEAMKIVRAV